MSRHRQTAAVLAAAVAVAFLLAAQAAGQSRAAPPDPAGVPRINQEEFRRLYAANAVLVVDVRNALAFEAGRIPGALHVPVSDVDRRATEVINRAKDRPIVTYCSCPSENSSAEAGWLLLKHGARDVRALVGGYVDWARNGGKIER